MSNFIVGQKATVLKPQFKGPPEPVCILTVTRVTKLFVELDDGSQWSLDDRRGYPKNQRPRFGNCPPFVEPGGTEDIQRRADANAARMSIEVRARDFDQRRLTDDAALQILAIWDADIEARKAKEKG